MWGVAKELQIPLDHRINNIFEIPYTLSFVIRKRMQIDNLNELPKEKRPPEMMIWEGSPEEIEDWLAKVLDSKKSKDSMLEIDPDEIE